MPPSDPNLAALAIVQQTTGEAPAVPSDPRDAARQAAAMLGRLGGLKGGVARAKALSKKKRAEIAKKAARTRWRRHVK